MTTLSNLLQREHIFHLSTHQPFMTTLWLFLHHINSYYRLAFTSNGIFFHLSHLTSENITSLTSQAKLSPLLTSYGRLPSPLFISVPDSDKLCHETDPWEVIPNISVYWPTCRSQSSSNYYQTIESSLSSNTMPTILKIFLCVCSWYFWTHRTPRIEHWHEHTYWSEVDFTIHLSRTWSFTQQRICLDQKRLR